MDTASPAAPAPDGAPRRILIVDDHPLLRDGLAQLIGAQGDLAVCGQAASMTAALQACEQLAPDLAIVDIFLDGSNGIELTKTIRSRWPDMRILVLSMHDESLYAGRALRAGAHGYVMKQEMSKTILDALRAVLRGERYVSAKVEEALARDAAPAGARSPGLNVSALSDRELEVFELFGRGCSRTDIAARLQVSVKTVEAHRQHIRDKLGLRDSTEFMRQATLWVEMDRRGA